MDLRAKLWYFYSGAHQLQKSEPTLFSLLYFKDLQDIQLGYSKDNNKILNFVEMIDQGVSYILMI